MLGLNVGSVSQSSHPISCCSAANRSASPRFSSQARKIWPEIQAWVGWLMARMPEDWLRNSMKMKLTGVGGVRKGAVGGALSRELNLAARILEVPAQVQAGWRLGPRKKKTDADDPE